MVWKFLLPALGLTTGVIPILHSPPLTDAFQPSTLVVGWRGGSVARNAGRALILPRVSGAVLRSKDDGGDDTTAADDAGAPSTTGNVSIVYCTGCRWMMRAAYFAQELLTTFKDDLASVTLVPSRPPSPGGIFLVALDGQPMWNRKEEGRFPETKELKQRIRDVIAPDRDLGHSDVSDDKETSSEKKQEGSSEREAGCDECPDEGDETSHALVYSAGSDVGAKISPHVAISYCTGCKWMFRAAWYAQELLSTFQDDLNSVSLVPSKDVTGTFTVTLGDQLIWDRKSEGRHVEAKELKQGIRDVIAPARDLGHSDSKKRDKQPLEELSDEEAAEQRKFFGVM